MLENILEVRLPASIPSSDQDIYVFKLQPFRSFTVPSFQVLPAQKEVDWHLSGWTSLTKSFGFLSGNSMCNGILSYHVVMLMEYAHLNIYTLE